MDETPITIPIEEIMATPEGRAKLVGLMLDLAARREVAARVELSLDESCSRQS